MSTALDHVQPMDASIIEQIMLGNFAGLRTPEQRVQALTGLAQRVGIDPLTAPFAFITLPGGKVIIYATKNCTDQLRRLHEVSVTNMTSQQILDVYIVTTTVALPSGRTDIATGAVALNNAQGEALANAYMKAETKSKRRATLSLCGLGGIPDESEVDDIVRANTPTTPVIQRRSEQRTMPVTTDHDKGQGMRGLEMTSEFPGPAESTSPTPPATTARARPGPGTSNSTTIDCTVTQTLWDKQPNAPPEEAAFEIRVRSIADRPAAYILLTKDDALYKVAADVEGTDTPMRVVFHRARRERDGSPCNVLDAITAK